LSRILKYFTFKNRLQESNFLVEAAVRNFLQIGSLEVFARVKHFLKKHLCFNYYRGTNFSVREEKKSERSLEFEICIHKRVSSGKMMFSIGESPTWTLSSIHYEISSGDSLTDLEWEGLV